MLLKESQVAAGVPLKATERLSLLKCPVRSRSLWTTASGKPSLAEQGKTALQGSLILKCPSAGNDPGG